MIFEGFQCHTCTLQFSPPTQPLLSHERDTIYEWVLSMVDFCNCTTVSLIPNQYDRDYTVRWFQSWYSFLSTEPAPKTDLRNMRFLWKFEEVSVIISQRFEFPKATKSVYRVRNYRTNDPKYPNFWCYAILEQWLLPEMQFLNVIFRLFARKFLHSQIFQRFVQ